MLEKLQAIDATLLLFFNGINNPFFDQLFYWISYKWTWVPFYLILAIFIFINYGNRLFPALVFIAFLILISDQLSSGVIKYAVMRLRPCHEPYLMDKIHLVNNSCGGPYGFVSSHAANSFALAIFLSSFFKRRKPYMKYILFSYAVIVSYSRIYMGVHYPGDILGGILVGAIVAIAMAKTYRMFLDHYWIKREKKNEKRRSKQIKDEI
jgi:undecaprenyl-diphosphatase